LPQNETIIAAKSGDKQQIVYETADLWFHCLVMLAQQNIDARLVLEELERRFGVSGIDDALAYPGSTKKPRANIVNEVKNGFWWN